MSRMARSTAIVSIVSIRPTTSKNNGHRFARSANHTRNLARSSAGHGELNLVCSAEEAAVSASSRRTCPSGQGIRVRPGRRRFPRRRGSGPTGSDASADAGADSADAQARARSAAARITVPSASAGVSRFDQAGGSPSCARRLPGARAAPNESVRGGSALAARP
jgi:hypothetical protein